MYYPVLHAIDLFGTASFAFSGALRAIDRRPDFVGMVILAGATAVGGGVLRDLILQRQTFILTNGEYPLVIVLGAVVTFLFPARSAPGASVQILRCHRAGRVFRFDGQRPVGIATS